MGSASGGSWKDVMMQIPVEVQEQRYLKNRRCPVQQTADPGWPRRKKSDLMIGGGGGGVPRVRREVREKERDIEIEKEVEIRIKPEKEKGDKMWPRRKKSDLLIYQQTRNL